MNKRYCVQIEWDYSLPIENIYEECYIFPSESSYEEIDGSNMISGPGRSGYEFNIYNSLEEAIVNAHFNPDYISFQNMTEIELSEKDNILSKYRWDQNRGLIKK